MTSAFVSYSSLDRTAANYIAAELRNRGVDVFVDYQMLDSGNFMEQLANEIESREYFLVIISPRSIESDWVQAEVMWAFVNGKKRRMIPVWLEPASLDTVFPLVGLERVDFTRWNSDADMTGAIHKLVRLMKLSVTPINAEPVPRPQLSKDSSGDNTEQIEKSAEVRPAPSPAFTKPDVQRMFAAGTTVQDSDPVQALFLYQQVLEIDPTFLGGQIRNFVARQEEKTKPDRLSILKERMESAKEHGNWAELRELANSAKEVDPLDSYALDQIEIASKNAECEPMYDQAKIMFQSSNLPALKVLMSDIHVTCPDYGDPSRLLANQPISKELLGYVRTSHILDRHTGRINRVAFSSDMSMLATASTDHSVMVWSLSTGELLRKLNQHRDAVNSVAFSPDGEFLASVSNCGRVNLWQTDRWELIQSFENRSRASDVVFSSDSRSLISCYSNGNVIVHDVPRISAHTIVRTYTGRCTSLTLVEDGTLFVTIVAESAGGIPIGFGDSWIDIWRIADRTRVSIDAFNRKFDHGHLRKTSVSSDGKFLAAVGSSISIWKMPQGRHYWDYAKSGTQPSVHDFTFTPSDPTLLIFAGENTDRNSLSFFDISTKEKIGSREAHSAPISTVAVSSDGRQIATGSDDCTAKIWQL